MLKSEDVKQSNLPGTECNASGTARALSLVNIDDMELDGMLRDAQTPRNSFIAQPLSQHAQDLNFTRMLEAK